MCGSGAILVWKLLRGGHRTSAASAKRVGRFVDSGHSNGREFRDIAAVPHANSEPRLPDVASTLNGSYAQEEDQEEMPGWPDAAASDQEQLRK